MGSVVIRMGYKDASEVDADVAEEVGSKLIPLLDERMDTDGVIDADIKFAYAVA